MGPNPWLFRLDDAAVQMPPLRERGTDVLLLAQHLLVRFARQYGREPLRLGDELRRQLNLVRLPKLLAASPRPARRPASSSAAGASSR